MKRLLFLMSFAAFASANAYAVTATKTYVDSRDAATLSATSAAISAATNGLVTASVTNGLASAASVSASIASATNGLASQSSLTSLSSRVDDKRDKTDLAVYGKYVKWYIVETSGDGRLSEPIEMYDHGGYTFSCDKVNVSGDELHPNRIVCHTEYGDDGKVSAVSGGGETWWPGVDGNEPGYTTASVDMDMDAVNMIHDPAFGEFSAMVMYYDADGNAQYGMVRFRVTYTGGPHELTDTLAKTSELAAVSNAIPAAVSDLSGAGDYLKTADLAANESDPKWAAWRKGVNVSLGRGASAPDQDADTGASLTLQAAFGINSKTKASMSSAFGYNAYSFVERSVAFAVEPSGFYLNSQNTSLNPGSTARTLQSYLDERATTNDLAAVKATIPVISATDATFSNAVLAVGLNIDTNSVAQINELLTDGAKLPTSGVATVGGLLAALAAGLAALKKSVSSLSSKVDDANAALEEVA